MANAPSTGAVTDARHGHAFALALLRVGALLTRIRRTNIADGIQQKPYGSPLTAMSSALPFRPCDWARLVELYIVRSLAFERGTS